jgi:hypothetical protein
LKKFGRPFVSMERLSLQWKVWKVLAPKMSDVGRHQRVPSKWPLDHNDLVVKLEQLLEFGQEKIIEMGLENRKQAISLAKKQREKLLSTINNLFS